MDSGWRYRVGSVAGTAVIVTLAVGFANLSAVQVAFSHVPYFGRPAPEILTNDAFSVALLTTLVVLLASMWPLFKPRPRRMLDTILLTQRRVLLAMVGLAALGYFNYSYRLPRSTVMLTTATLLVALPLFMTAIRRRPRSSSRAVIIGDDLESMRAILEASDLPIVGYVAPPSPYEHDQQASDVQVTDGGAANRLNELQPLGGFARLEDVLLEYDIDTALLAFGDTDREEFFGTLELCHDHGVAALVHREHADHVLTTDLGGGELVHVDLEPLDWQDHVVKRGFDTAFAGVALLALAPVSLLIAVTIKLDDGGPVLYGQERTAAFGNTFTIYKFRSMTPDDESVVPGSEADRVTRVGRVLRRTHFDEIPQLWAILTGKMSVVGPRAVWTDEETLLETEAGRWRKRWFIKPGLTGLAQINDATSVDPQVKLRYDLEYIRKQSFWFDLKIVIRQLWQVGTDAVGFVVGSDSESVSENREAANNTDEGETASESAELASTEDSQDETDGKQSPQPLASDGRGHEE